jgi:hypothetical protein
MYGLPFTGISTALYGIVALTMGGVGFALKKLGHR